MSSQFDTLYAGIAIEYIRVPIVLFVLSLYIYIIALYAVFHVSFSEKRCHAPITTLQESQSTSLNLRVVRK